MIRVLVVLPFYGGSLPIGRYVVEGLKEAGCLVDVFEAPAFFSAFSALKGLRVPPEKLDYLENSFIQVVGQAIFAKAESFAPDMVLALAQAPLPAQTLKRLRKEGIPSAMWFVEDYRLFTYWRVFAPYYDLFAVIQKEPFLSELAALGVNALYLPLAAQPTVHKPLELSPAEKKRFGSDLSFMGAGYPNRRALFRELASPRLKIWGTEWEGEPALAPCVQAEGARISVEDSVRIYNASAINLNIHSSIRPEAEIVPGDFVNPRTFELAACGAFQLTDARALLGELFTPDEIEPVRNKEELKVKIAHYLENPEERRGFAEKARARVLAEHTYRRRMETLLEAAGRTLPGRLEGLNVWPAPRNNSAWPDDLPPELREQLQALIARLELPPEVDFSTLISALRARSGRLTPLESSLLFMDEWKKQYSR